MSSRSKSGLRGKLFRIWAALLALMLGVPVAMGTLAPAAAAVPAGIEVVLRPVVPEDSQFSPGSNITWRLSYDLTNHPELLGTTVTLELSDTVQPPADLEVPANAEGIESITSDGQTLSITFKGDDGSGPALQGYYDITGTINEVDESGYQDVTWSVGDEQAGSVRIIVVKPGDTVRPVTDAVAKRKSAGDFQNYVSVANDIVTVSSDALDQEITYTITVDSATARDGYTIADTIDPRMAYVPGSFSGTLTTYDEVGFKLDDEPFDAHPTFTDSTFTYGNVSLPANSRLTLTYTAKLTDDGLDELRAALQDEYDKLDLNVGGTLEDHLRNTATFGSTTTQSADVGVYHGVNGRYGGDGPDGPVMSKTSSLTGDYHVAEYDDNGDFEPFPVTYTLTTDLRYFTGDGDRWRTLIEDVIVEDHQMQNGIRWLSDENGFITLEDQSGTPFGLEKVDSVDEVKAQQFSYAVVAAGTRQNVYINVGQDHTKKYTITLKAQVDDLAGLELVGDSSSDLAVHKLNNDAWWTMPTLGSSTTKYQRWTDDRVIDPTDGTAPVDDSTTFDKTVESGTISVSPGGSADVRYTFTLNRTQAYDQTVDVSKTVITDYVDTNVFDLSAEALATIQASLEVNYNDYSYLATSYDLTFADGRLVLTPSDAFKTAIGEDATGTLRLTLTLPTHPIDGRQSIDVTNRAQATGNDRIPTYASGASSEVTTFGTELEIRKSASMQSSADGTWLPSLRIDPEHLASGDIGEDDNLFFYRIQLIPRGNFSNRIFDIVDVLPAGVEFRRLATPASFDDLGGNLEGNYDEDSNSLTLGQKPGTELSVPVDVIFEVQVVDWQEDLGIANTIGSTSATIVPTTAYPLNVVKVDSDDPNRTIASGGSFTVRDAHDTPVVTGATVANGVVVLSDGTALRVDDPGTYTITEDTAPVGYAKSDRVYTVSVDEDGTLHPATVSIANSHLYAIGDVVWIDRNRDGIQNLDGVNPELPLPGVTVTLLDAEGVPVAGVEPQTTDENGRYLFDNLPAGSYQVRFALTDAQAARYSFTTPDAQNNESDDVDSDATTGADPAVGETATIELGPDNGALTSDYTARQVQAAGGVDPTWDAGVVEKSYALGDVVWIDGDRDGIQGGADDTPLAGVTVTLTTPDGGPVTDVFGNEVAAETTDTNGRYLFDNLPAGEYLITFEVTEEQDRLYRFTLQDEKDDDAEDSDADPATGRTAVITLGPDSPLVASGDYDGLSFEATEGVDPTWDAGVIGRTYAVGDVVWIDADRDGVQGDDEPPLAGVRVTLYDGDGAEVDDTTTDEQGRYLFDNLPAGDYRITFTLTPEQNRLYQFTQVDAESGDDTVDSDADPATGQTVVFRLDVDNTALTTAYSAQTVTATEGIDPTWDAGVFPKRVSVGDYVWWDDNGDGIQDAGEQGIEGVVLTLTGPDGDPVTDVYGDLVGPVTTDEDGRYQFTDLPVLPEGQHYTVTVTPPAGAVPTTPGAGDDRGADSSTGSAESSDLTVDGASDVTLDFGFVKTYAVGDVVWIDRNGNGVQDAGEDPLPGVTVTLLDQDGRPIDGVEPVTTDENGRYLFDGLLAGRYQLKFTLTTDQAAIYEFTRTTAGTNGAADSNADRSGYSAVFTLGPTNTSLTTEYTDQVFAAAGGIDPTWDAGVVLKPIAVDDEQGTDDTGDTADESTGPDSPDAMPVTGADSAVAVMVAGLLLLIGGTCALVASRRRDGRPAHRTVRSR